MYGKFVEIEGIFVRAKPGHPMDDQGRGPERLEIRDKIFDKIRSIAGKDSIKRTWAIQNQGDHKTQDILFMMDEKEYMATLRYNNSMTEGRVEDLRTLAKKC
jgi:hypothetical protein